MTRMLVIFVLALSVAGCSDSVVDVDSGPTDDEDAGGQDASAHDASMDASWRDSAAPPDASDAPDASELDGGAPDGGTDAGPIEESCPTEGAMRIASCGSLCGTAAQRCSAALIWESASACLMEGECAYGSVESRATPLCGEESRLCGSACSWGDWARSAPDTGECIPGETRVVECDPGSTRPETCSSSCAWEPGLCTDTCGGTMRTSPPDAREVCVPAGPFLRGHDNGVWPVGDIDTEPSASIMMSAFYIDAFPVTNERYAACVTLGVCLPPNDTTTGTIALSAPGHERRPVQGVSRDRAVTFCAWDGSRRVPTEAEWEKAVRGPYPRANQFPWDDVGFRCDLLMGGSCGFVPTDMFAPDDVDALPGTRGYYGTEMQFGGLIEWTRDYYSSSTYSNLTTTDPTGPMTGTRRVARGTTRADASATAAIWTRVPLSTYSTYTGFRCARTP